MLINLNIAQNTFTKHMLDMGYNYSIIDYNKFILAIRKYIENDIIKSIQDGYLSSKLNLIFGDIKSPNLLIFEDISKISNIEDKYLGEIINMVDFNKFFKEKDEFFIKDVQVKAYEYILLENIQGDFTRKEFKYFYKKGTKLSYDIKKCAKLNNMVFSDLEKEDIKQNVINKVIEYYFSKIEFYVKYKDENKKIIYNEMFDKDFDFLNEEPFPLIASQGIERKQTKRFDEFLDHFTDWIRLSISTNIRNITYEDILNNDKPEIMDPTSWADLVNNIDIYLEYKKDIDDFTGLGKREVLRITNTRKRIVKDILTSRLNMEYRYD